MTIPPGCLSSDVRVENDVARISDTASPRSNRYDIVRALPLGAAAGAAAWICSWNARGSVAAADWLAAALILAALVATVVAAGAAVRPSRAALAALAALGGLAVWTWLSLLWSPLPSLGRDEALLTVAYGLAFALPVLVLRTRAERLVAVGAVGGAAAAVALGTAWTLTSSDEAAVWFAIGRLEFPISYANAEAAVLLVGFWPCIAVAATRAAPVAARAGATGGAALLLGGWLATQSKGGGIGLAVSTLVVLALSPSRLRLVVPVGIAAACAGAAIAPLTEPYRAEEALLGAAAAETGRTLFWVAAAATGLGLAAALADRRIELGPRAVRLVGRAAAVAAAAAAVAAAVLAVSALGRPDEALADAWRSFSTYHDGRTTQSHLVSLGGSNRYDFWRVALEGAREEPLAGIGARGFQARYLVEGRSSETPARAHSLPLETLLELGGVGLFLLLAALLAALWPAVAAVRRAHLWAVAALGGCVAWLAHASVDWTWTFPAAGIPFFLLLGIGASSGGGEPLGRAATVAGGAAALVAGAVLFAPAWISARLLERAFEEPGRAGDDLALARRLDPVTVRPLVAAAQLTGEIAPLRRAARREPESVGVRYQLGVRLLEAGRREEARRELEAARALAPREPLVAAALRRAAGEGG